MFKLSIWNAWLLSLPFLALGVFSMGMKKDIAKRMSDMTGYSKKEKFFTIAASVASYPFLIATVWIPFTTILPLLCLGITFYLIGIALFAMALKVIFETPHNNPFCSGPYRYTRNPLYMAATIVFTGICLSTASIMLSCYLVIAVLLQHFMILAEEQACKEKYGMAFENYLKTVPRYLFI